MQAFLIKLCLIWSMLFVEKVSCKVLIKYLYKLTNKLTSISYDLLPNSGKATINKKGDYHIACITKCEVLQPIMFIFEVSYELKQAAEYKLIKTAVYCLIRLFMHIVYEHMLIELDCSRIKLILVMIMLADLFNPIKTDVMGEHFGFNHRLFLISVKDFLFY